MRNILEITSLKSCEQSNLCSIFAEEVVNVALNLSLPFLTRKEPSARSLDSFSSSDVIRQTSAFFYPSLCLISPSASTMFIVLKTSFNLSIIALPHLKLTDVEIWSLKVDVVLQRTSIFKTVLIICVY